MGVSTEGTAMNRIFRPAFAAFLLIGLSACGQDEGRGGLTAEEERQLDEAARMLEDNMIDVSPDSLVANAAELEALEAGENGAAAPPADANSQ